jgi:hypothetical protein
MNKNENTDYEDWAEVESLLKDIELLLKHVIWRIREEDSRIIKKRRRCSK